MIQVVHRAFDILELCAKNPEKVYSLSEIADRLQLNHTTCANIVKTLVTRNYIEQIGYKKGYRLGVMAFHLTGNLSFRKDLVKIAKKHMVELVEELNETCLLSILQKTSLKRVVLHEEQSRHELMIRTILEKDISRSATGRLLSALLSDSDIHSMIKKFGLPSKDSWPEASTKEGLWMEIKRIREDRIVFHYDKPKHIVGFAVPVVKDGALIAALSIYMPEIRYRGDMMAVAPNRLKYAAERVNNELRGIKVDFK